MAKVINSDITITSLETIMAFNPADNSYMFTLDELQNTTIANSEEAQDITGKQGRLLNSLKQNKGVTVSGTNGLISGGLLAAQVGTTAEQKDTLVKVPDYLTVENDGAATTKVAVGTVGNEIGEIFIRNSDGTLGDKFIQNGTADTGKFAYDPSSRKITFKTGEVPTGTNIICFYNRLINANVVENLSGHYASKAILYIDCFGEDRCNNIFHIQFYVPRADFNGTFDIALGDSQAAHAFEARALSSNCGGMSTGQLWTYTIFPDDVEDVIPPVGP